MSQDNNWSLYFHTNKTNHKIYVGISGINPLERWSKGYKHCTKFYRAINKYGWDGFEHSVAFTGMTKDEAQNMQKYLIKQMNLQDDRYGYNITEGGSVPSMTEETKRKISIANIGHGYRGGGNKKRKVMCVQTNAIFQSCSQAARWCGSNSSHISNACMGKFEKTKGYHWKYV